MQEIPEEPKTTREKKRKQKAESQKSFLFVMGLEEVEI